MGGRDRLSAPFNTLSGQHDSLHAGFIAGFTIDDPSQECRVKPTVEVSMLGADGCHLCEQSGAVSRFNPIVCVSFAVPAAFAIDIPQHKASVQPDC